MKQHAARIARLFRLNFCGLIAGTVFYCFALTPSLLPRPAAYAGLIAGISFAVGYAIGVAISWIIRQTVRKEPPRKVKRIAWRVVLAGMAISVLAYTIWNASWENQVRELIGETTLQGQHIFTIVAVAFVLASVLIAFGRLIGVVIRFVSGIVGRWVPARISVVIGSFVVAVVLIFLYNGLLVRAFVDISNNIYLSQNRSTAPDISEPISSMRSGGPDSLVPWNTLGYQGRNFVGTGPGKQQLSTFSGQPADEPIRVYVGVDSAASARARAELAVRELERTGAFSRPVLAVMTPSGTGWIAPQAADSFEYMWNGNSAIAAIQYSYLPSWISFLVDQQKASEAGRELFNAVYQKWKTLPVDNRPKLLAFGLSLGSFGAQAAFSGVDDLQNRTNGALFMGTPSYSQPWGQFKDSRDPGSPEWQPVYQQGRAVRFAATNADIASIDTPWNLPRILYMQHASDPVVWWNYNLLWHKPDWLKEPRGPDVSPNMQWYPFITFAQVAVDQFFGLSAPDGHGHNYGNTVVAAWSAVAAPDGWTPDQAEKLQAIIDRYPSD